MVLVMRYHFGKKLLCRKEKQAESDWILFPFVTDLVLNIANKQMVGDYESLHIAYKACCKKRFLRRHILANTFWCGSYTHTNSFGILLKRQHLQLSHCLPEIVIQLFFIVNSILQPYINYWKCNKIISLSWYF